MKRYILLIKRTWMSFAHTFGKVNTIILLSIVYFVVIGIMSLVTRILRKDLLQKKIMKDQTTYWQPRVITEQTLERSRYQF